MSTPFIGADASETENVVFSTSPLNVPTLGLVAPIALAPVPLSAEVARLTLLSSRSHVARAASVEFIGSWRTDPESASRW